VSELPFSTEHARNRAEDVLAYVGVTGAAMLVSPEGEVAMTRGAVDALDVQAVARTATSSGAADRLVHFTVGGACVHAAPVFGGWVLCVVSTYPVAPVEMTERVAKAAYVLRPAFTDGTRGITPRRPGGGGEPPTAEVFAFAGRPRRS
jgi:hypothetical protein